MSFGERQVRCDNQGGAFRSVGDDLEQELGTDVGERNIADLIECNQVVSHPSHHQPLDLAILFRLDEFVHQGGRCDESDALLLMTRC